MIRFLVFTDLHYDHVFDANERINTLIEKMNEQQLDFAISLGDLCYPIKSNNEIIKKLNNNNIPIYYVVGNHDIEHFDLKSMSNFLEQPELFYSFIIDHTKFIVLNSCYMRHNGQEIAYQKEKYDKKTDIYPLIPEFEINWLKAEMNDDTLKYVIFSHHSLANEFAQRGIVNRKIVRDILETKKTILSINGHDHGDDMKTINQISYFTANSASYIWHGMKASRVYPEDMYIKFPGLQDLILYKSALYCIVEIEDEYIKIHGMNSEYMGITPENIGIANRKWNGVSIEPKISNWESKFH